MLLTGEQLQSIYCKTIKIKKTTELECNFPTIQKIDGVMYEGFIGLFFTVIFIFLHIAFFVLNRFVKKDFVKSFATAILLPLAIGEVCRFIQIILTMTFARNYFIVEIFNHVYTVCETTSFLTSLLGITCFLFSHMFITCTGKPPNDDDSWSTFFTIELFAWILSGCYHFTSTNYRKLPVWTIVVVMYFSVFLVVVSFIASAITMLSCGKKRFSSDDPVVKYGFLRLIWAKIVTVFGIGPACLAMVLYASDADNHSNYDGLVVDIAVSNFYWHRILEFITTPYMMLTIAMLPTYRDAFGDLTVTLKGVRGKQRAHPPAMVQKATTQSGAPLISGRQQVYPTQQQALPMIHGADLSDSDPKP